MSSDRPAFNPRPRLPVNFARALLALLLVVSTSAAAYAQIGKRFPSEKRVVIDPVTGVPLTFLTSTPAGDSKIYPTHRQWTSDGKWLVFRSNRVKGEAMAVNEETGDIVQVTEGGYTGMLCLAENSMNLYFLRTPKAVAGDVSGAPAYSSTEHAKEPSEIVRVDLAALFADSAAGTMREASSYQKVLGSVPLEFGAVGDVAIDVNEDFAYFRVGNKELAARHLPPDAKVEPNYGPRNMGAGPTGLASMNLSTGEVRLFLAVPFQIGHVQTNPYVPGEIVFCWETGGEAPQRTWTVKADGTGLRMLYPETPYDWVTHEAVITRDEVAFAIMGHREIGVDDAWGKAGSRERPTGLGIVNLRTGEMHIAGQTKSGSGLWHVHGSADGRWAVGDDFSRSLYLIDRRTGEMRLLTTGHKQTAADHPHPTFHPDGTRIQIQSAMLSEDDRSMNICIVPVPDDWLLRTQPTPTLTADTPQSPDPAYRLGSRLVYDDFTRGLDAWRLETAEPGKVTAENGILRIDVPAGCTLWRAQPLEGPVLISYDAVAVDRGGPNDRVSDLNCFWMATDARSPADLFATPRSGAFEDYDALRGYYVGLGGNENTTTRFRRYIGELGNRPLLPEHDLGAPEHLLKGNRNQHIQLIAADGDIAMYRDGQLLFRHKDPEPYRRGHFGFRTVKSHLEIRNFQVFRLEKAKP